MKSSNGSSIAIIAGSSSIDNKLTEMVSAQQKKNEDIEYRLRTVERWTYMVPAALISSVVSIITMVMRG